MLIDSIKNGVKSGLKTFWFLIKIIIPVYLFITILKHTPAMDWLVSVFAPFMGVFNLPGEAALPIITGMILDEFGIISAIKAVNLTGFTVTAVSAMALTAHSLLVEGAIVKKMGLSVVLFTAYRIIGAVIVGFILRFLGVVFNLW